MAGNIVFYVLDTTHKRFPVQLFINGQDYGEYRTGRKYQFDVGLGDKEIYVIVKQGIASFASEPLLLANIKPGELFTLYAGYRHSSLTESAQGAFINTLGGQILESFGFVARLIFGFLTSSPNDYQKHVIFGRLNKGETIDGILEMAWKHKRQLAQNVLFLFGGLLLLYLLTAVAYRQNIKSDTLLFHGLMVSFLLGFTIWAVYAMSPRHRRNYDEDQH